MMKHDSSSSSHQKDFKVQKENAEHTSSTFPSLNHQRFSVKLIQEEEEEEKVETSAASTTITTNSTSSCSVTVLVKAVLLSNTALLPKRATDGASGYDLYLDEPLVIPGRALCGILIR